MTVKNLVFASILLAIVSPAYAAPSMTVIPQGIQAGNWVWQVNITPDLSLSNDGSTPLAVELGFRLTGDPLVSVTNLSPLVFDTNNPGKVIFGWEMPYGSPPFPEAIEVNCASCTATNLAAFPPGGHPTTIVPGTTNEIFAAMGSIDISTPGPVPFLRIVAAGPGTGGPLSSTIQWLGAYSGNGRIAQIVGTNGQNFDIFAGSATQAVPEPVSAILMAGSAIGMFAIGRRRSVRV